MGLSVVGVYLVRTREGATQKELLKALNFGVHIGAVLIAGSSLLVLSVHAIGAS